MIFKSEQGRPHHAKKTTPLSPLSSYSYGVLMSITFKVWHCSSMANYVAIGINVDGKKDSFYAGRTGFHETFYYNPNEKTFNPDCMKCWFPAEKLAAIKLEFITEVLGESFQKFLGEK